MSVPYLPHLAYPAAEALIAHKPVLFLPLGALEAHGPHLPLETDSLLSLELARRAGRALIDAGHTAAVAAPVSFAVAGYASGFAGTLSLPESTAIALLRDVTLGLQKMGFTQVCYVNSHLDPSHVEVVKTARAAVEQASSLRVAFPDQLEPRWARTLSEEYKRGACHAGSYETSLLLASPDRALVDDVARRGLEPIQVNLAKAMRAGAKRFEEVGATRAYFGDPAGASVEEGESLYARLVEMVVTTVRETWSQR